MSSIQTRSLRLAIAVSWLIALQSTLAADGAWRISTFAGNGTAGQVLVMPDMLGVNLGKTPKFVRNFLQGQHSVQEAFAAYVAAVKDGSFPDNSQHAW